MTISLYTLPFKKLYMLDILMISIALIALMIGSFTDLKTREVPDWLNYGLIISGFAIRLIYSLVVGDFTALNYGIAGFIAFVILAYGMFYAGQWGGGDSKMIMGLGVLLGLNYRSLVNSFLLGFFINLLLVGAIYGLLWSLVLMVLNFKKFLSEFKKIISNKKLKQIKKAFLISAMLLVIFLLVIPDFLIKFFIIVLVLISFITLYLWIFIQAIEKSCMVKPVDVEKLTEGDWIVKEVKVEGKRIAGPKDLGISKKQIQQLLNYKKQGKIRRVQIKEGIPFIPSFLIAFIITLIFGNILWLFL